MANVKAVLWDFGGVITSSPFEAFEAYERRAGLPVGMIRNINTINPDGNAWAKFERNEISRPDFCVAFEKEARALGHEVNGAAVLACLQGAPRPIMVRALARVRERYTVACLTNNVAGADRSTEQAEDIARIMKIFHHVVESSKVGLRKPERGFYELALETVGAAPEEAVFLDDLGVNLKTAREMGMTTIKVVAPEAALAELGAVIDMDLLSNC